MDRFVKDLNVREQLNAIAQTSAQFLDALTESLQTSVQVLSIRFGYRNAGGGTGRMGGCPPPFWMATSVEVKAANRRTTEMSFPITFGVA